MGTGKLRFAAAALAVTVSVVGTADAQFHEFGHNGFDVRRLAIAGDPAPGMPPGVTLTGTGIAKLGLYGGIAFSALLEGPGVVPGASDEVLYTLRGGGLAAVARLGDPAPGVEPPATFSNIFLPRAVNASGDVAFDGPARYMASWVSRPGLQLLATAGLAAPGTGGLVFRRWASTLKLSESGHAAFSAGVGPSGTSDTQYGIWSDRGGTLTRLYDGTAPAPAPVTGATLGIPRVEAITPDDRIVFGSRMAGPDVTSANDTALFAERDGQLKVLLREGDPAPGTGAGAFVQDLYGPGTIRVRSDGLVSMRNILTGPGVTPDTATAIWSEASGELRLVSRAGDPAPQAGDGMFFRGPENVAPAFNAKGETVFKSALRGPGATGQGTESVWLDDNGTKTLLARLGQHAPGFAPETIFTSFQDYTLGINDLGESSLRARSTAPTPRGTHWPSGSSTTGNRRCSCSRTGCSTANSSATSSPASRTTSARCPSSSYSPAPTASRTPRTTRPRSTS